MANINTWYDATKTTSDNILLQGADKRLSDLVNLGVLPATVGIYVSETAPSETIITAPSGTYSIAGETIEYTLESDRTLTVKAVRFEQTTNSGAASISSTGTGWLTLNLEFSNQLRTWTGTSFTVSRATLTLSTTNAEATPITNADHFNLTSGATVSISGGTFKNQQNGFLTLDESSSLTVKSILNSSGDTVLVKNRSVVTVTSTIMNYGTITVNTGASITSNTITNTASKTITIDATSRITATTISNKGGTIMLTYDPNVDAQVNLNCLTVTDPLNNDNGGVVKIDISACDTTALSDDEWVKVANFTVKAGQEGTVHLVRGNTDAGDLICHVVRDGSRDGNGIYIQKDSHAADIVFINATWTGSSYPSSAIFEKKSYLLTYGVNAFSSITTAIETVKEGTTIVFYNQYSTEEDFKFYAKEEDALVTVTKNLTFETANALSKSMAVKFGELKINSGVHVKFKNGIFSLEDFLENEGTMDIVENARFNADLVENRNGKVMVGLASRLVADSINAGIVQIRTGFIQTSASDHWVNRPVEARIGDQVKMEFIYPWDDSYAALGLVDDFHPLTGDEYPQIVDGVAKDAVIQLITSDEHVYRVISGENTYYYTDTPYLTLEEIVPDAPSADTVITVTVTQGETAVGTYKACIATGKTSATVYSPDFSKGQKYECSFVFDDDPDKTSHPVEDLVEADALTPVKLADIFEDRDYTVSSWHYTTEYEGLSLVSDEFNLTKVDGSQYEVDNPNGEGTILVDGYTSAVMYLDGSYTDEDVLRVHSNDLKTGEDDIYFVVNKTTDEKKNVFNSFTELFNESLYLQAHKIDTTNQGMVVRIKEGSYADIDLETEKPARLDETIFRDIIFEPDKYWDGTQWIYDTVNLTLGDLNFFDRKIKDYSLDLLEFSHINYMSIGVQNRESEENKRKGGWEFSSNDGKNSVVSFLNIGQLDIQQRLAPRIGATVRIVNTNAISYNHLSVNGGTFIINHSSIRLVGCTSNGALSTENSIGGSGTIIVRDSQFILDNSVASDTRMVVNLKKNCEFMISGTSTVQGVFSNLDNQSATIIAFCNAILDENSVIEADPERPNSGAALRFEGYNSLDGTSVTQGGKMSMTIESGATLNMTDGANISVGGDVDVRNCGSISLSDSTITAGFFDNTGDLTLTDGASINLGGAYTVWSDNGKGALTINVPPANVSRSITVVVRNIETGEFIYYTTNPSNPGGAKTVSVAAGASTVSFNAGALTPFIGKQVFVSFSGGTITNMSELNQMGMFTNQENGTLTVDLQRDPATGKGTIGVAAGNIYNRGLIQIDLSHTDYPEDALTIDLAGLDNSGGGVVQVIGGGGTVEIREDPVTHEIIQYIQLSVPQTKTLYVNGAWDPDSSWAKGKNVGSRMYYGYNSFMDNSGSSNPYRYQTFSGDTDKVIYFGGSQYGDLSIPDNIVRSITVNDVSYIRCAEKDADSYYAWRHVNNNESSVVYTETLGIANGTQTYVKNGNTYVAGGTVAGFAKLSDLTLTTMAGTAIIVKPGESDPVHYIRETAQDMKFVTADGAVQYYAWKYGTGTDNFIYTKTLDLQTGSSDISFYDYIKVVTPGTKSSVRKGADDDGTPIITVGGDVVYTRDSADDYHLVQNGSTVSYYAWKKDDAVVYTDTISIETDTKKAASSIYIYTTTASFSKDTSTTRTIDLAGDTARIGSLTVAADQTVTLSGATMSQAEGSSIAITDSGTVNVGTGESAKLTLKVAQSESVRDVKVRIVSSNGSEEYRTISVAEGRDTIDVKTDSLIVGQPYTVYVTDTHQCSCKKIDGDNLALTVDVKKVADNGDENPDTRDITIIARNADGAKYTFENVKVDEGASLVAQRDPLFHGSCTIDEKTTNHDWFTASINENGDLNLYLAEGRSITTPQNVIVHFSYLNGGRTYRFDYTFNNVSGDGSSSTPIASPVSTRFSEKGFYYVEVVEDPVGAEAKVDSITGSAVTAKDITNAGTLTIASQNFSDNELRKSGKLVLSVDDDLESDRWTTVTVGGNTCSMFVAKGAETAELASEDLMVGKSYEVTIKDSFTEKVEAESDGALTVTDLSTVGSRTDNKVRLTVKNDAQIIGTFSVTVEADGSATVEHDAIANRTIYTVTVEDERTVSGVVAQTLVEFTAADITNAGEINVTDSTLIATSVSGTGTFNVSGESTLKGADTSALTLGANTTVTLENGASLTASNISGGAISAAAEGEGMITVASTTISSNIFTLAEGADVTFTGSTLNNTTVDATVEGADVTFTGANTLNGTTLNAADKSITNSDTLTVDALSSVTAESISGGSLNITTASLGAVPKAERETVYHVIDADSAIGTTLTVNGEVFVDGMSVTVGSGDNEETFYVTMLGGSTDVYLTSLDRSTVYVGPEYTTPGACDADDALVGWNAGVSFTSVVDSAVQQIVFTGGNETSYGSLNLKDQTGNVVISQKAGTAGAILCGTVQSPNGNDLTISGVNLSGGNLNVNNNVVVQDNSVISLSGQISFVSGTNGLTIKSGSSVNNGTSKIGSSVGAKITVEGGGKLSGGDCCINNGYISFFYQDGDPDDQDVHVRRLYEQSSFSGLVTIDATQFAGGTAQQVTDFMVNARAVASNAASGVFIARDNNDRIWLTEVDAPALVTSNVFYVNSDYTQTIGLDVSGDNSGKYFGVNAFTNMYSALRGADPTQENATATVHLESDVTLDNTLVNPLDPDHPTTGVQTAFLSNLPADLSVNMCTESESELEATFNFDLKVTNWTIGENIAIVTAAGKKITTQTGGTLTVNGRLTSGKTLTISHATTNITGGTVSATTDITVQANKTVSLDGGEMSAGGKLSLYGAVVMNDTSLITANSIAGTGTITINVEEGFSGIKKVVDLNSGECNISLGDHPDGVTLYYDAVEHDYWLRDAGTSTVYIDFDWSNDPYGKEEGEGSGEYYGYNAFATVQAALATNPAELVLEGGTFDSKNNIPTLNGVATTISGGNFTTSVCGGYLFSEGEGLLTIGSSTDKDMLSFTIMDGTFGKSVFVGDRVNDSRDVERIADVEMTISGGNFNNAVAGGMALTNGNGFAKLNGNVSLTISGGSYDNAKGWIYGGCLASSKTDGASTTITGKVTVTIDATGNDVTIANMVVGSYGGGKIKNGTELVLKGGNIISAAGEIWGGSSSDILTNTKIKKEDGTDSGNRFLNSSVSGKRILSFTGFTGTFTSGAGKIRAFSDVEVKTGSDATIGGSANLSDVVNWTFEKGSKLTGNFSNDFNGDTMSLTGFAANDAGAFVLMTDSVSDSTDIFNKFDELDKAQVKLGEGTVNLTYTATDGVWRDENNKYSLFVNDGKMQLQIVSGTASNWTFEKGSTLTGNFDNNFAGDTLNLTGFTEAGSFVLMTDSVPDSTDIFNGFEGLADIRMNGNSVGIGECVINENTMTWSWSAGSNTETEQSWLGGSLIVDKMNGIMQLELNPALA